MRALATAVLVLVATACTSQTAPQLSTPSPKILAKATPGVISTALHVGQMAVVAAGQLRQVADPNRPSDRAYESAANAESRILRPLGESQRVLVVGGPTNPNGDVYWQIADDPFPGCCAPFGWVRESSTDGNPAIKPYSPPCPAPGSTVSGDQLIALGLMEASTCLGTADFKIHGEVKCDRPPVQSFVSITGPDWVNDQTLCNLDNAVALYGAVTDLYSGGASPGPFDADVDLVAHFNEPTSRDCRWAPGNFMPIPLDDAPVNTAQFACAMSVYVTKATLSP